MKNPYKPGAGHTPPHLAGRKTEKEEFEKLLAQEIILQNLILTGLRGIGKTALLENFKPLAKSKKWLWAGTDCSESASVDEETIAVRLIADIALITSGIKVGASQIKDIGFVQNTATEEIYLNFAFLMSIYHNTPGLVGDKLKYILEIVWKYTKDLGIAGIVFAYDEAQTLSDHAEEKQYPLSLLLDVFQSTQKKNIPFMLVLTGLPTLLSKLVESRTYSERLFRVLVLDQLNKSESKEAIVVPLKNIQEFSFSEGNIEIILRESGGYPYFLQFISREVFEVYEQQGQNNQNVIIPIDAIVKKLDNDFFAGRWNKASDREKELLTIIAELEKQEFTISEVVEYSKKSKFKPFGRSHVNQLFARLTEGGLLYKSRHGVYSFAVPLLEKYILRTKD